MTRLALAAALLLAFAAGSVHGQGAPEPPWRSALIERLCQAYADPRADDCLEAVAATLGRRLAEEGTGGAPAEDVAALALLMSSRGAPATAPSPPAAPPQPDDAQPELKAIDTETRMADLGKGQEGFRQGVERLAESPLSERMVVTGDLTSGFQSATVTGSPDLTSAFGRARVNFVARAAPARGSFEDGYFFVQMIAAGGPFDSSPVGGPSSFSALTDVATDRSAFNEPGGRGNLYMAKAFYQQDLRLSGDDRLRGRAGVIDLSDFFDTNALANNEARQFLNGAFVNSPAFKAGVIAPGFMGEYSREIDRGRLQRVILRTGYAISRTARAFTSPLWVNEIEAHALVGGREGQYRFGGSLGNVPDAGAYGGWHLSFDQWLSDRLGVYGRYARSNEGAGSLALGPVKQSYGGGVQWRLFDDRDYYSAWGVGFSQAFGIERAGMETPSERILEAYYRWQAARNFSLTPDFQLIFGSGGSRSQGTHAALGLRMNFGF